MPYPSTLGIFTDPTAGDRLNSPSHSSIETAQNTGLEEIQAFVGTESSAIGTIFYDVRAAASDGGGHVQSANKGGTGQTSFTKGDLLVATSSSVLSKLAAGADGLALVADSSVAAGVAYKGVATAKEIQDQKYTYAAASVLSASVYGITFPQIVSVLSAGQAFAIKWPNTNTNSVIALQVSSLVAQRIFKQDLSNPVPGDIRASMIGIVENDGTNWQLITPNNSPIFRNGITTKNLADADAATTVIAHTLGVIPKRVRITAMLALTQGDQQSVGVFDAGGQNYVQARTTAADNTNATGTGICRLGDDAARYQIATCTVDATNITLTWAKTSTPAGTFNIIWEACA